VRDFEGREVIRPDRVDVRNGRFYEIRPNTPGAVQDMERQLPYRQAIMDQYVPLGGGRRWSGEVVTYDKETALRILQERFGMSAETARKVLEEYGFTF
jgi:hypothetical protein